MVVHFPKRTNKYGMVVGFSIALLLRVLSGEPVLKYNAVLKFAGYVEPYEDADVSVVSILQISLDGILDILNLLSTLHDKI
jgi:hypothetical protein